MILNDLVDFADIRPIKRICFELTRIPVWHQRDIDMQPFKVETTREKNIITHLFTRINGDQTVEIRINLSPKNEEDHLPILLLE